VGEEGIKGLKKMKPRLLDLFCGAGGATKGYQRAGFYVVGVDIKPQPHYCGDEFYQADALEFPLEGYDAYHASPPCQFGSNTTKPEHRLKYTNLIPATRDRLITTGKPFVIENVFGTRRHLRNPLMLCGTMFGLQVIRHRYFETTFGLLFPPASCCHQLKGVRQGYYPVEGKNYVTMTGNFKNIPYARKASGIPWMTQKELSQAIPPAYTEYIGKYLLMALPVV